MNRVDRVRVVGAGDRRDLRVLVPGAGRPVPGTDRGVSGPPGPPDERRGTGGRGRAGPVDRVAAPEDPHRGSLRPGRAGRQRPALPHQRGLHRMFPVGRRRRHGPAGPGPRRGLRMTAFVRPMTAADAAAVLAIYQAGLDGGNASFETTAPTWTSFDAAKLPEHRFVAADADGTVLGWVAAS